MLLAQHVPAFFEHALLKLTRTGRIALRVKSLGKVVHRASTGS